MAPGQVTPFLCSHFLRPVEQISRDQRFVDAFVALAVPVEFAKINRIVQNLVDRRLRDSCAAPAKTEAFGEKYAWLRDRKEYEFFPSGNCVFTILTYCGECVRKVWLDGKRQRLENCLNSIIAGLSTAAEGVKAHRLKLERWERERQEQEH